MKDIIRGPPPTVSPAYTNDLTAPLAGAITPTRQIQDDSSRRKQTLLCLLDALNELAGEGVGGEDSPKPTSYEDTRDAPSIDEDQVVGAEAFHKFERRMNKLDKELRNFGNSARQLGSSVGILSSSFHLRSRLAQLLHLFRENASELFPRKVKQPGVEGLPNPNVFKIGLRAKKRRRGTRGKMGMGEGEGEGKGMGGLESLDVEGFPEQLRELGRDVVTFLKCLNEFPEFQDEAVNSSIHAFKDDLEYWASCLGAYEGQFKYPAVRRYLHDLSSEMGDHLDVITSNLGLFIEVGVPTIRFAQKHAANNLLNLSTVATFFSAVTATTLQYSYETTGGWLNDSVNAFWFTSMVFSIGAAVNSLLGVTWKQAMYRSPGNRVPWWVLIWIKRSPLVFLVISVACFSVGLVLFSYSSGQNYVVSIITTVFTAFSSFGLAAVSAWVACERWIFNRHKGNKWLGDVLSELQKDLARWTGVTWTRKVTPGLVERAATPIRRASKSFSRANSFVGRGPSVDEGGFENGRNGTPMPYSTTEPLPSSPFAWSQRSAEMKRAEEKNDVPDSLSRISEKVDESSASSVTTTTGKGKGRFAHAVRSVMKLQATAHGFGLPGMGSPHPRRQGTGSSAGSGRDETIRGGFGAIRRIAALSHRLKSLEATQVYPAHQALVRHLQFSPNGRFLATSSWDRTSVIFEVGDPIKPYRTLAHPQGFVGQAAWSPSGNLLLTKMNRGVRVWTEDGVCRKTIDRRRTLHSVAWFPGGEAFMSVEGSGVTKLDLNGKVLDTYTLDRLNLHDVAVTHDCARLLAVGVLSESPDRLKPRKSRAEKQIIVYNLDKKEVENQVPVLHDVRDITLARNGRVALVSYENKAPPQLWKLETVKDRDTGSDIVRLQLQRTYVPKIPVDFAGPSYFGGKDDQLIICAGKAGDIHIWDREFGDLLRYIQPQGTGDDMTCIAWNQGSDTLMFATGSHDGIIRIWTPNTPDRREGRQTPSIHTLGSSPPIGFGLDIEVRTESPSTEEFDPSGERGQENVFSRDNRTVTFATRPS